MSKIPQSNFQSPDQLGIKSTISDYTDVDKNLNIMDEYMKGQLGGDTIAINKRQSVAKEPFGNRYFVNTNTPCFKYGADGSANRHILVDDMKYMKDSQGNLDTSNYGLLYSAEGSLQEIEGNNMFSKVNMNYNPNAYANKCVPVSIYLDKTQSKTDTQYMTIADCNRIDSVALSNPNQCPPLATETFVNNGSSDTDDPVDFKLIKKFVLEDDFITKFYFGSVTVIGLFILYRLYEKK